MKIPRPYGRGIFFFARFASPAFGRNKLHPQPYGCGIKLGKIKLTLANMVTT